MSAFDVYLTKLAGYIEEMRGRGRQVREIDCPTAVSRLLAGLPVRVGRGASSGIILRSDTFVELGNPDAGSCAFVLWTDNPSLVRDGKITLIGPDIQESREASCFSTLSDYLAKARRKACCRIGRRRGGYWKGDREPEDLLLCLRYALGWARYCSRENIKAGIEG